MPLSQPPLQDRADSASSHAGHLGQNAGHAAGNAANSAQSAGIAAEHSTWFEWLARFGYAAKGVVYLIIGALAAKAAFSQGGATVGKNGAVRQIYQQPYGQVLLGIIVVGFVGVALWSFAQSLLNADGQKRDLKGYITRAAYFGIGLSYGGLAIAAAKLILSGGRSGAQGSSHSTQDWTARLLNAPAGVALVVLVGLVVLGVAAALFYTEAYKASFSKHMSLQQLGTHVRDFVLWSGRIGYAAMGVIACEIGIFLIVAAFKHQPGQARGLSGALSALIQQPWGQWLLGLVAFGLILYGLFNFTQALYHRIA